MMLLLYVRVPAPPELYTLSLHDALPILVPVGEGRPLWSTGRPRGIDDTMDLVEPDPPRERRRILGAVGCIQTLAFETGVGVDRKSTRLNSRHVAIPYPGFCLTNKYRLNV